MNEFCCVIGICDLRHLGEDIRKRKAVYEHYVERLGDVAGIRINSIQEDVIPNYTYFPILIDAETFGVTRDTVYTSIREQWIYARKYFFPLTNAFDRYKDAFVLQDTPVALYVSNDILCLPMCADLSVDDVDRICDQLLSIENS